MLLYQWGLGLAVDGGREVLPQEPIFGVLACKDTPLCVWFDVVLGPSTACGYGASLGGSLCNTSKIYIR